MRKNESSLDEIRDEIRDADEMADAQPDTSRFSDAERPLRADARQNRAQILQAAHKTFAAKGLSVPISEIAREAGIGVGTVYRHFPTKEVLFNAVILSYKQTLAEEARSLIDHDDPGKAFFALFSRIMAEGFTNRAVRDAFRSGAIRVRTATSGTLLDFQSACTALLVRAQRAKAVREDIDIMDVMSLVSGLLMIVDEDEGAPDRDRFDHLLSIVCDGLRYRDTLPVHEPSSK